jgi:hypothetical protein
MQAQQGDMIVVRSHHIGEPARAGEIVEVLGDDGGPPYRVRWDDNGHVTLFFPGTDAIVEHITAADTVPPS